VDAEAMDRQFSALQQQARQTAALIQSLANKLSASVSAGDPNAREWGLDLKEIALAIRDEESTTTQLLQSVHALASNHVAAIEPAALPYLPPPPPARYAAIEQSPTPYYPPPSPAEYPQQPQYPAPMQPQSMQPTQQPQYPAPLQPQQVQQPAQSRGRRLFGGFGEAMAAGAGIGIGEAIIESIFDAF
jgi:hypothetical protein